MIKTDISSSFNINIDKYLYLVNYFLNTLWFLFFDIMLENISHVLNICYIHTCKHVKSYVKFEVYNYYCRIYIWWKVFKYNTLYVYFTQLYYQMDVNLSLFRIRTYFNHKI